MNKNFNNKDKTISSSSKERSWCESQWLHIQELFMHLELSYKILAIIFFTFLGFKQAIEKIAMDKIIEPYLYKFKPNIFTNLFFIGGVISLILYCIIKYQKNIHTPGKTILYWGIATVLTLCYKYWFCICDFVGVFSSSYIAYLDFIGITFLALSITQICLFIKLKKTRNKNDQDDALYIDDAILYKKQDKLAYDETAVKIAQNILKVDLNKRKKSLTIGIVARWGHGKTSFINLIKEQLKDKCIQVDFTPWSYENKSLTSSLIMQLAATLKSQGLVYRPLHKYSNMLIGSGYPLLDLVARCLHITNSKSIQEEHEYINKKLKKIGQHIVVYIDDLDRLEADEILETLKLVRNTVSFSNITYIIGCDKSYIANTLKEKGIERSYEFLGKFFQYEYYMPQLMEDKLLGHLWLLIEQHIKDKEERKYLEYVIQHDKRVYSKNKSRGIIYMAPIKNLRDVTTLANQFIFKYNELTPDIHPIDLLNLCILSFKYPAVYTFIEENYRRIFERQDFRRNEKLTLYTARDNVKVVEDDRRNIMLILTDRFTEFDLKLEQVATVQKLIYTIFKPLYDSYKQNHRINQSEAIDRYFYNRLFSKDIKSIEFNNLCNLKEKELRDKLELWKSPITINSLLSHIHNTGFKNFTSIRDEIDVYFMLSDMNISTDDIPINHIVDRFESLDKTETNIEYIKAKLQEVNTVELSIFLINEVFRKEKKKEEPNWLFPISEEELINISTINFESLLSRGVLYNAQDRTFKTWEAARLEIEEDKSQALNKEVDTLLCRFINEHKVPMLGYLIYEDTSDKTEPKYSIIYAEKLWGSWHNFKTYVRDYVSTQDTNAYLQEFTQFIYEYAAKKMNAIPYKFKEIVI